MGAAYTGWGDAVGRSMVDHAPTTVPTLQANRRLLTRRINTHGWKTPAGWVKSIGNPCMSECVCVLLT